MNCTRKKNFFVAASCKKIKDKYIVFLNFFEYLGPTIFTSLFGNAKKGKKKGGWLRKRTRQSQRFRAAVPHV